MSVVVLYFAALRELMGKAEEALALPSATMTIAELGEHLARLRPALRPHLGSVRFAINESFVSSEARVSAGDRVALLPPVSGG